MYFKVTTIFDAEYVITIAYKIDTYLGLQWITGERSSIRPAHPCNFEWPWTTFSDLAKYLTSRSIARRLCDTWASCFSSSYNCNLFSFYCSCISRGINQVLRHDVRLRPRGWQVWGFGSTTELWNSSSTSQTLQSHIAAVFRWCLMKSKVN